MVDSASSSKIKSILEDSERSKVSLIGWVNISRGLVNQVDSFSSKKRPVGAISASWFSFKLIFGARVR